MEMTLRKLQRLDTSFRAIGELAPSPNGIRYAAHASPFYTAMTILISQLFSTLRQCFWFGMRQTKPNFTQGRHSSVPLRPSGMASTKLLETLPLRLGKKTGGWGVLEADT